MAVYGTYNALTNHEDLSDVLTKIGQMNTPVYSGLKKTKASARLHEWSTYDYASADDSGKAEGFTYSYGTLTSPASVTNYTQIFNKAFQVSNTQIASDPAGMEDEYAFRVEVALKEIGRNIEKALVNGTGNSGASATARELKGMLAFITNNVSTGTGTGRALTETELNSLLQEIYSDGGNPNWLIGSFRQKRAVAELASSNRSFNDGNKTFTSDITVYESPFGRLVVDGDSQMPSDTLVAADKAMWEVAQLRPVAKKDTPETADAKNGVITGELTLVARADKFNGKMTGLKTS